MKKKKKLMWNEKERVAKYDVEFVMNEVIQFNNTRKDKVLLNNHIIKSYCSKYEVFRNSQRCLSCGLEGKFFAVERDYNNNNKNNIYNLNLYGIENKREILFTVDHIKPKSKGGKNCIENYTTMCFPCNQKKGNKYKQY